MSYNYFICFIQQHSDNIQNIRFTKVRKKKEITISEELRLYKKRKRMRKIELEYIPEE